ncbi:hypothetical protein CsSME_00051618 [Camellia sinensis var. sinensis]
MRWLCGGLGGGYSNPGFPLSFFLLFRTHWLSFGLKCCCPAGLFALERVFCVCESTGGGESTLELTFFRARAGVFCSCVLELERVFLRSSGSSFFVLDARASYFVTPHFLLLEVVTKRKVMYSSVWEEIGDFMCIYCTHWLYLNMLSWLMLYTALIMRGTITFQLVLGECGRGTITFQLVPGECG